MLHLDMLLEVIESREAIVAAGEGADKWLLASVRALMAVKVTQLFETFPTTLLWARVWPLTRMCPNMLIEVTRRVEDLRASVPCASVLLRALGHRFRV
jgi:hypothetical protein